MNIRSKRAEYKMTQTKELQQFRQKGERRPKPCHLNEKWTQEIKCDTLTYADDLSNKANGAHEIYPKIKTFEECAKTFQININCDKIKIIYKQTHFSHAAVRNILPGKYRNIQFLTNGLLLGQQITLNNQTNCTVMNRLQKARGAWNILKNASSLTLK